MSEIEDWGANLLKNKTEVDIELAKQMAEDSVNILQATPQMCTEEGVTGWTILFEYHFEGPVVDEGGASGPRGGGWRKYAVEWPGGIPTLDVSLVAGIRYCYTLAQELRAKLGQGE